MVTVVDNTDPQIIIQDVIVSLDENGEVTISPEMLDNGSSDNCGIVEMSTDIGHFTCDDIGANAVVLTLTDAAGNTASGTAIVTVEDNMAPIATCPENMVLPYCNPVGEYDVPATDNCTSELTYQFPVNYPSGSVFPTGVTEMEVTVADDYGNKTICQFSVTKQQHRSATWVPALTPSASPMQADARKHRP